MYFRYLGQLPHKYSAAKIVLPPTGNLMSAKLVGLAFRDSVEYRQ